MDTIKSNIIQYISESIDPSMADFELETDIRSLGLTSMKILHIVMRVEKRYNIVLPDDVTFKIKTVSDFVEAIENEVRAEST